jgi:hypothetical protein
MFISILLRSLLKVFLFLGFISHSIHAEPIENANDMCYMPEDRQCQERCSPVGWPCEKVNCVSTIPIRNVGGEILDDVVIIYGQQRRGGDVLASCETLPSGTCDRDYYWNIGWTTGLFDKQTNFIFDDSLEAEQTDASIVMGSLATISLFDATTIYATYKKNGQVYQGKLFSCDTVPPPTTPVDGERDFELREKKTLFGDVQVIGNTVLCKLQNGVCQEPNDENSNADTDLSKAPESYSELTLPATAIVEYARIYWQGRKPAINSSTIWDETSKNSATKIGLKLEGEGSFTTLKADIKDFSITDVSSQWTSRFVQIYSASADASSVVHSGGKYYVDPSTFYTSTGETNSADPDDSLGSYGAWVLVVIYSDEDSEKARNITIFDGYKQVTADSENVDISLNGFLTPRSGEVDSKTYVFTAEGDKNIGGDTINMAGVKFNTSFARLGTFDSRIDLNTTRSPELINNNGIDIHAYNSGTTEGGLGIIQARESGARFRFTSDQDTYFPSLVVFSTEVFLPELCYDYAYKQSGRHFTEQNSGEALPKLVGSVFTHEPIEMTLFVQNLVNSDILVTDMVFNVVDINTTQATYIDGSVQLAKTGDLVPKHISPTTSSSSITGINIGNIGAEEYFYLYYNLDPSRNLINMPINAYASYNIQVDGISEEYYSILGVKMPMCKSSNHVYNPVSGIFNVVHNDYYKWDGTSGTQFYNLPTQITSREGNFKVIALNKEKHDLLENKSSIVAVEMFDVGQWNSPVASCLNPNGAISERIWVIFDDANSTMFNKTALNGAIGLNNTIVNGEEFYQVARGNAAFRVSYNVTNDGNDSLVELSPPDASGNRKILNYSHVFQGITTCSNGNSVLYNNGGSITSSSSVTNVCGEDGDSISHENLQACMECIYRVNTKAVCSRDNFAIRPEAFLIKLNDQEQNNPTAQARLADNVSGVGHPDGEVLKLAAGYHYNIEVNATSHVNNNASPEYVQLYDTVANSNNISMYFWEPRDGKITTACNDTNNKGANMRFMNGMVDTNTSINQIGHYTLKMRDNTWTTVDNNFLFMTHHKAPYFLVPNLNENLDCIEDKSTTREVDAIAGTARPLNGCVISSQHDRNSTLKYRDYNLTIYPYKFDLTTTTATIGLKSKPLTSNSYIYMADMSRDENISFHLSGSIIAQGRDEGILSNFVDSCFAVPLDLNISKSDTNLADINGDNVVFQALLNNLDINGDINSSLEQNDTITTDDMLLQIPASYFQANLNGSMNSRINLNYFRSNAKAANPIVITYTDYNVSCRDAQNDCQFNANLTSNKKTEGGFSINNNITYYYARSHSPRYRFSDNNGTAFIYYEVFCSGAGCNTTLLQDGTNSTTTDDPRWFINTQHNLNLGTAGVITQRNNTLVTATDATGNHQDSSFIQYDGTSGYPYKTTMYTNASNWLIYNKYNQNAIRNRFDVEFMKSNNSWAGIHETDTHTKKKAATQTNRRSMW